MLEIKRILVPVDFEDCSKAALESALRIAAKHGATIELLHVWVPPSLGVANAIGPVVIEAVLAQCRAEANSNLAGFVASVPNPDRVLLDRSVVMGNVYNAILERAESCDLVVMGTHGRRGFAHMVLGSVTERVMRECAKPVLIVRARDTAKAA